jgi:hypothetical protein
VTHSATWDPEDGIEFRVAVERPSHGEELGLDVEFTKTYLVVTQIVPGLPFAKANASVRALNSIGRGHEHLREVIPGDHIVSVNGRSGDSKAMVDVFESDARIFELLVRRSASEEAERIAARGETAAQKLLASDLRNKVVPHTIDYANRDQSSSENLIEEGKDPSAHDKYDRRAGIVDG